MPGIWQAACKHCLVNKESSEGRVSKSKERVKEGDKERAGNTLGEVEGRWG